MLRCVLLAAMLMSGCHQFKARSSVSTLLYAVELEIVIIKEDRGTLLSHSSASD